MKIKRTFFLFFVFLTLAPILLAVINIQTAQEHQNNADISAELIHAGTPAGDWTMKELKSDVNKTFSVDFSGKVVMIDFFATWCAPCRDAMPLIKQIYDHFSSEPKFALMSISVDTPTYNESDLEAFAESYNMDWFLFHDKTYAVSNYYGVSAIPTMVIISKTGYVYYLEEGFGGVQFLEEKVQTLLDLNDNSKPVVHELSASPTAISVVDNDLTITTNVTDDLLRHLKVTLSIGTSSLESEIWNPSPDKLTHSFTIDPRTIWAAGQAGHTNITVELLAEDYVDKSEKATISVGLTPLTDAAEPEVSITSIKEIDSNIGQNFKISASFSDDLLLVNKSIQIWIGGELAAESYDLKHDTGDVYYANFYSIPVKKKLTIEIKAVAEDVAGNISEDVQTYVVTDNTGITFPLVLGGLFLANLLLLPLYRKQRKIRSD